MPSDGLSSISAAGWRSPGRAGGQRLGTDRTDLRASRLRRCDQLAIGGCTRTAVAVDGGGHVQVVDLHEVLLWVVRPVARDGVDPLDDDRVPHIHRADRASQFLRDRSPPCRQTRLVGAQGSVRVRSKVGGQGNTSGRVHSSSEWWTITYSAILFRTTLASMASLLLGCIATTSPAPPIWQTTSCALACGWCRRLAFRTHRWRPRSMRSLWR